MSWPLMLEVGAGSQKSLALGVKMTCACRRSCPCGLSSENGRVAAYGVASLHVSVSVYGRFWMGNHGVSADGPVNLLDPSWFCCSRA